MPNDIRMKFIVHFHPFRFDFGATPSSSHWMRAMQASVPLLPLVGQYFPLSFTRFNGTGEVTKKAKILGMKNFTQILRLLRKLSVRLLRYYCMQLTRSKLLSTI